MMTRIEVFDAPMCCSSGVCGPDVDPLLAAFAADVDWLAGQGVEVVRHNLAQDPQPFVTNAVVLELMQREGDGCLPVVIADGTVISRGAYPRRGDLARAAGLVATASTTKPKLRLAVESGCCQPKSGCC